MTNSQSVFDQVREVLEEIGPTTQEQEKMILQKYGVIPPQLTASEKNMIIREERNDAKRNASK